MTHVQTVHRHMQWWGIRLSAHDSHVSIALDSNGRWCHSLVVRIGARDSGWVPGEVNSVADSVGLQGAAVIGVEVGLV